MGYTTDTRLDSTPQGGWTRAAIEAEAKRRGAKRWDDLMDVLDVYWSQTALNPEILAIQSFHETGGWTSYWYETRLNLAGIGITGDPAQNAASRTWATGTAAAWSHVTHLGLYAFGEAVMSKLPVHPADDPRWTNAIEAGYAGTKQTIGSLTNTWAIDSTYGEKLVAILNQRPASDQPQDSGNEGRPAMALTFGTVPHPGYIDIRSEMAGKREGVGWDNLGKRQPKFIALHRMWGTLAGTRAYFGNPTVPALTDYGIGVAAVDGAASAGVIHLYNDPRGYRSGWASGRVSAPYGDGLKFVNKYGVNAVNRDGVSFEISGKDEPLDAVAWTELVKLAAYWCDQMEIPYSSLPLNPHTGINAFIWHEEFTIGTGKRCPFDWVKANTNRLYVDTAAYMKPYQEGQATDPGDVEEPETPETPKPQYAAPAPIDALIPVADTDHDTISAIATREADEFIYVGDRVEAIRDTPRLRYAADNAKHVGPVITAGEQFDVDYLVKAGDGGWYYVSPYWTRIRATDTKRISDTPAGAGVA